MASAVISGCPEEPDSPLHSGGLPGVADAGGKGAEGATEPVVRPGNLNGNQPPPSAACASTWPVSAKVMAGAAATRPVWRNNPVISYPRHRSGRPGCRFVTQDATRSGTTWRPRQFIRADPGGCGTSHYPMRNIYGRQTVNGF